MRRYIAVILRYRIWLAVMLALNLLFGMLLWLQDETAFDELFPVMFLGSMGIYGVVIFFYAVRDSEREKAVLGLLAAPKEGMPPDAVRLFTKEEYRMIMEVAGQLLRQNEQLRQQEMEKNEYEDYIGAWAHEIKTPLSLMTFVLDNRQDELSLDVRCRLEYAKTRMQEYVEQMLYYVRMQNSHTDYLFEPLSLAEICREAEDEYSLLMEGRHMRIMNRVGDEQVITDRRGLAFCLSQVLSNALKYRDQSKKDAWVCLSSEADEENGRVILSVRDNGTGVQAYDRPFIFDKGFTGDKGSVSRRATGMGLYLTAQVASNLKIELAVPECSDGFEIQFIFAL